MPRAWTMLQSWDRLRHPDWKKNLLALLRFASRDHEIISERPCSVCGLLGQEAPPADQVLDVVCGQYLMQQYWGGGGSWETLPKANITEAAPSSHSSFVFWMEERVSCCQSNEIGGHPRRWEDSDRPGPEEGLGH